MNRVGKYAVSADVDELELLKMVYELTEKDRMLMWSEGYIDRVIEKLPVYAQDILQKRKEKWENTKSYVQDELEQITNDQEFMNRLQGERKEFALFVMKNYRTYQTLLFSIYDKNLKEDDVRKFVYRRKFGTKSRTP